MMREKINWLIDEIDEREHMFVRRSEEDIDLALAQIKKELLEKLPKEKPIQPEEVMSIGDEDKNLIESMKLAGELYARNGFNKCRSRVRQIIEEVCK